MDMPRSARVTIQNGCYHIITRGNQKQTIFIKEEDYQKYLYFLKKYKKRYKFKLYCFCLMPNHIHLMMEVDDPNKLSKIMHGINLSYAIYFNYKYKKSGHLWQDRFISKIICKNSYLIDCINYIEANPIRANLTENLIEYPWSSYRLRLSENNGLIDPWGQV
jgi:putative transposase